jgi:hypothetical protein
MAAASGTSSSGGAVAATAQQRRNSIDLVDMVDESSDGEQPRSPPSPEQNSRLQRGHHQQHGMSSPGGMKSSMLLQPRGGRVGFGVAGGSSGGGGIPMDGADLLNDAQLTAALLKHAQHNYQQQSYQLQSPQDNVFDNNKSASSVALQQQLNLLQHMQQQKHRQFQHQQEKRLSLGLLNNTDNNRFKDGTDTTNPRRKSVGDGVSVTTATNFSPLTMPTRLQRQESGGVISVASGGGLSSSKGTSGKNTLAGTSSIGAGDDIVSTTLGVAAAAIKNRTVVGDDGDKFGMVSSVPRTVRLHTHLLDRSDVDGERLRSFYRLSIDELFSLPISPTDEEYCSRSNVVGLTPSMIPGTHLAALSAVRFAEAALGAIVNSEIPLGTELCNAVVHCLRESVQDPIQTPVLFEIAKSYFLLSVFRAFRGDMIRYFKYRRVCLNYVAKLSVSTDSFRREMFLPTPKKLL